MGVEDAFKRQFDKESPVVDPIDNMMSLEDVEVIPEPEKLEQLPGHWPDKLLDIIPDQEDRESLLERVISGQLTDDDRNLIKRIRSEMGFVTQ